jgi:hypothetical protein
VESLTLNDLEKFDIIVSASPLHLSPDQEFSDAATLTNLLYRRLHYKRLIYMIAREASNLYYSRLKVSNNQLDAKAQMIYLIRESRHMGISLGLDSLRSYAIDIDIRSLTDYLFFKSQGVGGLSKDLKWLYKYIDPRLLRNMAPRRFIVLSRTGAIGYGVFPEVPWHKQEKEDILKSVGIEISYGEPVEQGKSRGARGSTIGDKEHSQIIEMYVGGLSMNKISVQTKRSTKSIKDHIDNHNAALERAGFCASCRRVKSKYEREQAICRRE